MQEWQGRPHIHRDYQVVVNEMRAFPTKVSHWMEQVDLSKTLPREGNKLCMDVFQGLTEPTMLKLRDYMDGLESEVGKVEAGLALAHRTFTQAALHPLLLRAPFTCRMCARPFSYTDDYKMVNQILSNLREGSNTYFRIVNTAFSCTDMAETHCNHIDILVQYLSDLVAQAKTAGRTFKMSNVSYGPAMETQHFVQQHPEPPLLTLELMDLNEKTLDYTRGQMRCMTDHTRRTVIVDFVHESIHQLLKRCITADNPQAGDCDAVYCAGLFDYLSNKVYQRLLACFASRTHQDGAILAADVYNSSPMRLVMEHVLEWYLVYRDEPLMVKPLPEGSHDARVYTDAIGINISAQTSVARFARSIA